MRDREHRSLIELFSDYPLNFPIVLNIHISSRLIQHQNLVAAQKGSGQTQELLLAS